MFILTIFLIVKLNCSFYDKNNKKSNSLYKDSNIINRKYNFNIDKNGSSFVNNQIHFLFCLLI